MRISIAGNLCRQCRSTAARICTDRLFCCTAQDRPDSLASPSLTQLLMILWKDRSWKRYAIVRRKHEVTMKSRTWFTQVCAVQVFMPLSLQIGIKYSHTTTSAPQELTTGMTVVCIMDLKRKLWRSSDWLQSWQCHLWNCDKLLWMVTQPKRNHGQTQDCQADWGKVTTLWMWNLLVRERVFFEFLPKCASPWIQLIDFFPIASCA